VEKAEQVERPATARKMKIVLLILVVSAEEPT
jgi:hypothetical protein